MQGIPFGDLTSGAGGWEMILVRLFGEALLYGIKFGMRQYKRWRDISGYQEELFEVVRVQERQPIIGLRHGDKPSKFDAYGAGTIFVPPIIAKFGRLLPHRYSKEININYEKHHVFVGGWRPIQEVEEMLRQAPYIFGIEKEDGTVYVPERDELRRIRENEELKVPWIICENRAKPTRLFPPLPDPTTGTWKQDVAVLTFGRNPLNPSKKALAVSGTHAPGTAGACAALSHHDWLKQIYEEAKKRHLLGTDFQVILRFLFKRYGWGKIPQIRDISIEDMLKL